MSERILMIETSTDCCSVALAEGNRILAERICEESRQHAAILAPYISEVLQETGLKAGDLNAIAVSKGPGSYTGLRVGVSTAKGLCFGSGKPLIGVDTLQILALQGSSSSLSGQARHPDRIVPMIDARRMEVYAAVFDGEGHRLSDTEAVILDGESYHTDLKGGSVLFIGTGAGKFQPVCHHPNATFLSCSPLASFMLQPALSALQKKEFEDTAYFEPFYLKEFVAGISKKSVL